MTLLLRRGTVGRILGPLRRAPVDEAGFTIVETLMAALILLIVAASLAGVLTSSIAAHTVSRERTIAEQVANDQVESIRRLPYDSIGTVSGNPPGVVAVTRTVNVNGLAATVTTQISYVDDPAPTSYATAANYKRVIVTVTRDKDGKVLTRVSTFIAPPARAPYGGINNAIINATVIDLGSNQPYVGATVNLLNGPSSNRSDVTDATGSVSFAALTPNPLSGAQAYYDLTVSAVGYQTLTADVPPGTATPPATASHIQLAPSQTSTTSLRIFKPATINVLFEDAGGSPYTGGASLTVDSSFTGGSTPFTVPSGSSSLTITSLSGEPVIPGATYTLVAKSTSGLCGDPSPSPVPASGYPTVTSHTFVVSMIPCPAGTLSVDVVQVSQPAAGATVDVTGGPNNMTFSGTTDSAGNVVFSNVPSGAVTYTVTATKGGQSATASPDPTITTGATTSSTVTLPDPPSGTVSVTVNWGGSPAAGATVDLTGGPYSISVSGTANGSGQVSFVNIPAGSGYTLTATKAGESDSASPTVTAGSTTNATLNLPTGTLVVDVQQQSLPASGATVTVTGGPNGSSLSGTTNGSGQVTFTNVPAGTTAYTVTATKGAENASDTATITASSTTNVSLTLPDPVVGTLVATVVWAGSPHQGATVTLAGGPGPISLSGTSNSSGQVTFVNVPAGSGYTVTATDGTASDSQSATVTDGGTTNTTLTLPTGTVTVNVKRFSTNQSNATVRIQGGPLSIDVSGTTNFSGNVTFVNIPVGTGYTIKGWKCTVSSPRARTLTSQTVASGSQTVFVSFNSGTCPP